MIGRTGAATAGVIAGMAAAGLAALPAQAAPSRVVVEELRLSESRMDVLNDRWYRQLRARYGEGNWAPARMELGTRELRLMGLPDKRTLLRLRRTRGFATPTVFHRARGNGRKPGGGSAGTSSMPVAAVAGAGYFGIRPGAWLLLINGNSIGWCSAAHVYGAPGAYKVSTAGHCGKTGDVATVIGVVGNRNPVLMDFGKFSTSHDGGIGRDWALISVSEPYQSLVSPTMAFWGGPRGVFTKTGTPVGVTFPNRGLPSVTVTPDPLLAQQIVHYGHGTGVGAGGTPRSGTALTWGPDFFSFIGAISPGDSGSGSNTLLGDTPGAALEAAGINTHLVVDSRLRYGIGFMAGTRTTVVGTPAIGQLVGYPYPVPILP